MVDPEPRDINERMEAQLLQRRVVMARGALDDQLAARVAAQLMWLDGSGDGVIDLHVDTPGGPLATAFTVMDTIELLGVPVHAHCLGRVEGSGVGVVAVCERRTAARHAQFHLVEPRAEVSGRAAELERWAEHHQRQLAQFVNRLATATGRPAEHVEAELVAGRWMDAEAAVAYGLIQEIAPPGRGPTRPPGSPPMGYGRPA
ncbi:MAG: ATP-dependent Clp protease proteolytic subunit [Acidimicrobiales bacterium]